MKYFGEKSISSIMCIVLDICWYLGIVLLLVAAVTAGLVIYFSSPNSSKFETKHVTTETYRQGSSDSISSDINRNEYEKNFSKKDQAKWDTFKKLPLFVKILIFPYFEMVVILLLLIIRSLQKLFKNFKNDVVFKTCNVELVSKVSKMLIVFSILTLSISSFLISIVMLLLCELIKNGSKLQEEHDFTV